MEYFECKNRSKESLERIRSLGASLNLDEKNEELEKLNAKMLEDGFWSDPKSAQVVTKKANAIKDLIEEYQSLSQRAQELAENVDLIKSEGEIDQELLELLSEEVEELEPKLEEFELKVLLSGEYDGNNAILELHPGAGGTESCDWAAMLYRMYSRYCEKKGFKLSVLDYQPGEEAGIKSVTFLVQGDLAYGYLKGEKGVHRLVRISPFDAGARRHTSFASLEVMPEISQDIEIEIKPEDLIIETKRASGAGGQHVNTTDSAIRMVHKPTGIVVTCQNGRSQIQNREEALTVLKSRLLQREIEEKQKEINELKGENLANEWGSQIRSYVLHPYSMIKDNRTGVETGQVQSVLDGDLDEFIYAYLKSQIN